MTDINKKADRATAVGVLQILAGSLLILVFWIISFVSSFWILLIQGIPPTSAFITFIGIVIGVILVIRGFRNYKLASRFRRVYRAIGDKTNIELSVLATKLNWSKEKLLKALNNQIAQGYWQDSFLDSTNGVFILGYAPTHLKTDSGVEAVDKMLDNANGNIHEMATINRSITNDNLKEHVERLIDIATQIYSYVEKNPEKTGQIRKFNNYFLPTTVNLLDEYLDLQNQAVKTENMQESMKKIEDTMTTIEAAFKKQLDSLYDDRNMDVSVEIDVMTKMMDV